MKQKQFVGDVGFTINSSRYEYRETDKTPAGAPNVVYIVMDDMGFAHLGCYGSHIHTPNLDRLAGEGLRYNNFHTTAICSATRASLLTGMNHHSAGVCGVIEMMTGCDNGAGHVHKDCATLAEILKEYDYATYAVGKWHLADISETTEAGPFDNWPLGKGFDQYYGFLHAQMDQYHPRLFRDNHPVEVPYTPEEGYHFSKDIIDRAIKYVFHQKTVYPEKPFFLYTAFGAMHTPHHAPKEYIDRYKGKFDEGWDKIREKWHKRQLELGIIPEGTRLTERNELVPAWDSLSDKQKQNAARYMEAFAGMLEYTDEQIGRLIDYIDSIGELDNTVVVFLSDNGASAEGGKEGTFNNFYNPINDDNGFESEEDYVNAHLDDIGSPKAFNHYPQGWANAGNTPFPWYKIFTYSGGVKDALIIRYPKLIQDPGSIRNQYHHVIDITPTILDILGVEKPETIKGVHQKPFEGISLKYTLEDGSAADRKHVQYYEMLGNRAIYKDGWRAITRHAINASGGKFEDDVWELYHVAEDFSESVNVADKYPEKVKELEQAWFIEAAKYGVFPMFDGTMYGSAEQYRILHSQFVRNERFESYKNIIEPVDLIRALNSDLNDKSHVVNATITRENKDQKGVILSNGNYHGGFVLFIKDNKLRYTFSHGGRVYYRIATEELPVGEVDIEYRFKVHKDFSADVELKVGGQTQASAHIAHVNGFADFISTIGANRDSAVDPESYETPFIFEGLIKQIDFTVEGHETTRADELKGFFISE